MIRYFSILALTTFTAIPLAHAATDPNSVRLGIAAGLTLTEREYNQLETTDIQGGDVTSETRPGFALSAIAEKGLMRGVGIESGAGLERRIYERTSNNATRSSTSTWATVPLHVRAWPLNFLSLAAGPYVGYRIAQSGANLSGEESFELGYDLIGSLVFSVADKSGVYFEGKYSEGFADPSDQGISEQNSNMYSFLAGVRFDLGETLAEEEE